MTLSADSHKEWASDAEPELRRIVKERDARILELEAKIRELTAEAEPEKPAAVAVFGRGKR